MLPLWTQRSDASLLLVAAPSLPASSLSDRLDLRQYTLVWCMESCNTLQPLDCGFVVLTIFWVEEDVQD